MGDLHEAARAGDPVAIGRALDAGADVEERDESGRTALMSAAETGRVDAIAAMLAAGADPDAVSEARDPDPSGPPAATGVALAIRHGLFERVWPILRGEVTVRGRRKDRNGPTALMIAAAAGRADAVDAMLAAGASPDVRDRDGFTALSYAAALGRAEIVGALAAAGADLEARDHYQMTPLLLATLIGCEEATGPPDGSCVDHAGSIRALLEAGADPDAEFIRETPLAMAMEKGRAEVVRALASGGSDPDRPDWRGLTPAMRAVARGDLASLRVLLEAGADPDAPVGPGAMAMPGKSHPLPEGATALHLAACLGDPEIVRALLEAGADPRRRDEPGFTPLMLASASGHDAAAAMLREASPPASADRSALRSLELVGAVRRGDLSRARAQLDEGASPDARTPKTFKYHYILRCEADEGVFDASRAGGEGSFGDEDRPVLGLALELGHEEIAAALIAAGASAEDRPGERDEPWRAARHPLIEAADRGRIEPLKKLLAAGADPDLKDRDGGTPILSAAANGHVEIVRALIAAGAKVNVRDQEKRMPLGLAAAGGHVDVVSLLLQAGAKVRPWDPVEALGGGHPEAARVLLEAMRKQKVKPAPESLASAIRSGSTEAARLLLDAGVDVNDVGGDSALVAACDRSAEMVRLLFDHGADIKVHRASDGVSALSRAVITSSEEVVRLLLENGADTEDRMDGVTPGETPLIRVAGHSLTEVFGRFMDREKMAAMRARDDEVLRLLLEHGADVEARDRAEGRTPLMHAAANGREDAVRTLIDAGADIDARDDRYGRTALGRAAIGGHAGAVRLLLAAGADAEAEDLDGRTTAELAAGAGEEDVERLLHAAGGRAARRGGSALGALKAAAEAGDVDAIRAALAQGVDVDARLSGGQRALFLAAEKGHAGAVAALLEAGADPDSRSPEGRTPLISAIEANGTESVRLLLKAGANPDAPGKREHYDGEESPLVAAVGVRGLDATDAREGTINGLGPGSVPEDDPDAIIRALIAAGADPDAPDEGGCRPLWYAFDTGQHELAGLLVPAGAGRDPVGATYLRAQELPAPARSESFAEAVRALAKIGGHEPRPITAGPSCRDWSERKERGFLATGPTIGAEVIVPRPRGDAMLAEHREGFLRRGAFLFRSRSYGENFDWMSQGLGLLPTVDKYVVIAAICGPGTDWGWVSPGFYIRDLRAIEADYPFTLVGCERRSIELEFAAPIPRVPELARRLREIRTTLGAPGLDEGFDFDELVEALRLQPRIGFYWE